VTDWVTISALATAGGTLVLAVATFASVRSANRAARSAEQSLLLGLRPVLMPSRTQDPAEKIGFMDGYWVNLAGGQGLAEVSDQVLYLAIALRNVGPGLAVLHSWSLHPDLMVGDNTRPDPAGFHQLTRDLYVPAGDTGFWQGTYRDPTSPEFNKAHCVITTRQPFTIDLLYSDHEGGQRVISRFALTPGQDQSWLGAVSHHWNLDRPNPQ
jgi:hypothetical protein